MAPHTIKMTVDGELVAEFSVVDHEKLLTEYQWQLLEKAERRIYRDGATEHGSSGYNGFTDVCYREQSALLVPLWDTAVMAAEMLTTTPDGAERMAAHRVAQAMKLINFGAESLLL